jgi:hypothetical protein
MRELNETRHTALLNIHQLLRWLFFRNINQALNPNKKEEFEMSYCLKNTMIPCF